MIVRSIEAIIRMLDADYIENGNIEEKICGVCIDSRRVEANNLYIKIGILVPGRTRVRGKRILLRGK